MIGAWLVVVAQAWAAPDDEAARVDALAEQVEAALAMHVPGGASPYHVRARWTVLDAQQVRASMGGLVGASRAPSGTLAVEVRVGTPWADSSGLAGWNSGFDATRVSPAAPPAVLATAAWALLDGAYKDAVEQLSRADAQVVHGPEHVGDYRLTGPVVAVDGRAGPAIDPALVDRAVALSAVLGARPGLSVGEVHLGQETGWQWVIDSEGTRVRRPHAEVSLRAIAHVVAPGGERLTDERLWTVREPAGLPTQARLEAEVAEMADALLADAAATPLAEAYVGPVVFEDAAAAALFQWLLRPQLGGTPLEAGFETWFGTLDDQRAVGRVGRRVLPPRWSVTDDPQAVPRHPGAFTHDDEGTPARAIELVRDGIVRTLATSRVPHPGVPQGSNGHARQRWGARAVGVPTLTEVHAPRIVSRATLRRRALRAAAAYGLDHVIVVRRLQHPSLRGYLAEGEPPPAVVLPPPVSITRLWVDETEERLRGARFEAVDRRALRDIVAAGPSVARDLLASVDGHEEELSPVEGTPGRIVAPMVVVGELELAPAPADGARVPVLVRAVAAADVAEGAP